jgi:hypothetical protein
MKITKKEIKNLRNLYDELYFADFFNEFVNTLKKLNFEKKASGSLTTILENKKYYCVYNKAYEQIDFAPKNKTDEAYCILGNYLDDDDIKIILKNVGE